MKLQLLLLTATVALALPKPGHVVHEKRFTETGLRRGERVGAGAVTTFRIGLKQGNLEKGYDYLMNVSHPSSSNYGKHWTADEVRNAFAPSAESIEAVQEWLASYGLAPGTEERGYLSIEIPVADAERLLTTKYYEHEDSNTGDIRIGCDEYALQALHQCIYHLTVQQVSPAKAHLKACRLCHPWSCPLSASMETEDCST